MTDANDPVATKHGGRSNQPRNPEVERFDHLEAASKPQSGPRSADNCQIVEVDVDVAAAHAVVLTSHARPSTCVGRCRDFARDGDGLEVQLRRARGGAA